MVAVPVGAVVVRRAAVDAVLRRGPRGQEAAGTHEIEVVREPVAVKVREVLRHRAARRVLVDPLRRLARQTVEHHTHAAQVVGRVEVEPVLGVVEIAVFESSLAGRDLSIKASIRPGAGS